MREIEEELGKIFHVLGNIDYIIQVKKAPKK